MGLHSHTVLKNSCIKVPINPASKLPSASYERKKYREPEIIKTNYLTEQSNISRVNDKNSASLKDFYKSIPDYKDVNHLSNQEFYLKLQSLKENKHRLLLNRDEVFSPLDKSASNINSKNSFEPQQGTDKYFSTKHADYRSSHNNKYENIIDKYIDVKNIEEIDNESMISAENKIKDRITSLEKLNDLDKFRQSETKNQYTLNKVCSPTYPESWLNESNRTQKIDFENTFDDTKLLNSCRLDNDNISKKSYSVPSSPVKKLYTPSPFSVSRRDADDKVLSKLKDYSKELEQKLYKKDKTKMFRANPVPIESRIPLFDKIMEDQELRRAMSKLQSKAELQALMKPFSFTEREEKFGIGNKLGCYYRLCRSNPQLTSTSPSDESFVRNKRFKAKPVPKSLFSNYIYEKMREDDFYRTLNRRIRAEEMLKAASLPPSMAERQKHCRSGSCNRYNHEETNCFVKNSKRSKSKLRKKYLQEKCTEEDKKFMESNCCSSNSKCNDKKYKFEDELKKIYGSSSSETVTPSSGYINRPRSDMDMSAINKSNLASVLRIESTKKKIEADTLKQLEEERYQSEMKWRDSVLRRKPAWKSLKYSHADDLAMRLQMRRDEERLRREQFLHEMELMYGRVHCQPMMFERCYSPRKMVEAKSSNKYMDSLTKPRSALSKNSMLSNLTSPNRSRKVSINETAETIKDDIDDYIYKDDDDDKSSKSSDEIPEEVYECKDK